MTDNGGNMDDFKPFQLPLGVPPGGAKPYNPPGPGVRHRLIKKAEADTMPKGQPVLICMGETWQRGELLSRGVDRKESPYWIVLLEGGSQIEIRDYRAMRIPTEQAAA